MIKNETNRSTGALCAKSIIVLIARQIFIRAYLAQNFRKVGILTKQRPLFKNLLRVQSTSNARNARCGLKNLRVATTWAAAAGCNSVTHVEESTKSALVLMPSTNHEVSLGFKVNQFRSCLNPWLGRGWCCRHHSISNNSRVEESERWQISWIFQSGWARLGQITYIACSNKEPQICRE